MIRSVLALVVAVLSIPSASAVGFAVIAPKARKLVSLNLTQGFAGRTVWDATVTGLRRGADLSRITFEAEGGYLRSINGLGDKVVRISSNEARYYGWCFSVNGQLPAAGGRYLNPDEVRVRSEQEQIQWFYAYATVRGGQWVDFCVADAATAELVYPAR